MEAKLNLLTRDESGKGVARKLRRAGRVPGVIYGGGGEPVMVSMEARETLQLFQSIPVDNTILNLSLDGEASPEQALVREVQVHPYRTELLHVDFIRVRRGVPIEVHVPVHLMGLPDGVRNEGGILEQVAHDIIVKCVPALIPEGIEVDVTGLGIGDVLRAGDVVMPEGVENLVDPERMICGVSAARLAEELEDEEEGVEAEPALETPTSESDGDQD
ncbi:MAG: 50S ribosomal protein L25 [Gemmatimonadetes bacterium]|nr:50S ribosomal protein L25 [Gemmatimonadota bacterium]MYA42312.1 50S ribosomal protein L25 [Gemmatimonadota bacterium]MYE92256.1 50S ribosomal protein L25 [Gemmatimonadota bacterium]MYJ11401.1 50S ribosomal protein L25 [Gemmatimonadota bacterium]